MTDNLLTWNVRNWITVVLMFLLAWSIIVLGGRFALGKTVMAGGVGDYMPLKQQVGSAGT